MNESCCCHVSNEALDGCLRDMTENRYNVFAGRTLQRVVWNSNWTSKASENSWSMYNEMESRRGQDYENTTSDILRDNKLVTFSNLNQRSHTCHNRSTTFTNINWKSILLYTLIANFFSGKCFWTAFSFPPMFIFTRISNSTYIVNLDISQKTSVGKFFLFIILFPV